VEDMLFSVREHTAVAEHEDFVVETSSGLNLMETMRFACLALGGLAQISPLLALVLRSAVSYGSEGTASDTG
jgi:hypothetical protein